MFCPYTAHITIKMRLLARHTVLVSSAIINPYSLPAQSAQDISELTILHLEGDEWNKLDSTDLTFAVFYASFFVTELGTYAATMVPSQSDDDDESDSADFSGKNILPIIVWLLLAD